MVNELNFWFQAINGSEAGFVLSALFMATLVHFLALQSVETGNSLTSVERIMEYGQLQPEASLKSTEGKLDHNIIMSNTRFNCVYQL